MDRSVGVAIHVTICCGGQYQAPRRIEAVGDLAYVISNYKLPFWDGVVGPGWTRHEDTECGCLCMGHMAPWFLSAPGDTAML